MKLNKFFMLGLAGLAFTACSNEEDAVPGTGDKDKVMITLSLGKAETRSLGETAAGKYNTLTDMKVEFYNAQGVYVEVPEQVEGDDTYSKSGAIEAAIEALKSGTHQANLSIKGVPASATQIYIVANSVSSIGTSSLNDARKSKIYLSDQQKSNFTVFSGEQSTLTGLGTIDLTTNKASVKLKPVPSRIEMQNVTAMPLANNETWGGSEIKSFKVKGFFINSFYPEGILDGTPLPSTAKRVDNGSIAANYTKAKYQAISYQYENESAPSNKDFSFMCDEPTDDDLTYSEGDLTDDETSNDYIYKAVPKVSTNNWGYQLLPGVPPHIVVKLNVTYVDNQGAETQADKYLTITKYKFQSTVPDVGTANEYVQEVLRGHVYTIKDINFDVKDLTDVPYEGTKTVEARVEVSAWVGVPVIPEFN